MAKSITLQEIVTKKLDSLEPKQSLQIREFVEEHWVDGYNNYTYKSFAVMATRAKKNFPEKVFRKLDDELIRIR